MRISRVNRLSYALSLCGMENGTTNGRYSNGFKVLKFVWPISIYVKVMTKSHFSHTKSKDVYICVCYEHLSSDSL